MKDIKETEIQISDNAGDLPQREKKLRKRPNRTKRVLIICAVALIVIVLILFVFYKVWLEDWLRGLFYVDFPSTPIEMK